MKERIAIVGGGIGGLTAAIALHQMGFLVKVFERAPVLREVGAGLGLLSNAMCVLDGLGLGTQARRLGYPLRRAGFSNAQGDVLLEMHLDEVLSLDTPPSHVVHRADLLQLLRQALPEDVITTNAECTGLTEDETGVTLQFAGRPDERAEVVVGADGINSRVRRILWGDTPLRYSGQTCYRGIARYSLREPDAIREINGPGKRAAAIAIGRDRVYWWAALNAERGEADEPALRRTRLLAEFAGWPHELPEVIAATPSEEILRNDLLDRAPLKTWTRGRVTLLGDAAHPMQPNLGQGACTAMEDGWVIASALSRYSGNVTEALRVYETARQPRTREIVAQSWRFGVPVRWSNPIGVALRDALTRVMPRSVLTANFRRLLNYDVTAVTV